MVPLYYLYIETRKLLKHWQSLGFNLSASSNNGQQLLKTYQFFVVELLSSNIKLLSSSYEWRRSEWPCLASMPLRFVLITPKYNPDGGGGGGSSSHGLSWTLTIF
ncbi:hypothetical protein BLOT_012820 [Blomia tropicalis]|nr:hypothetical protein BLOT_012820 [Blomia tropicalis]